MFHPDTIVHTPNNIKSQEENGRLQVALSHKILGCGQIVGSIDVEK